MLASWPSRCSPCSSATSTPAPDPASYSDKQAYDAISAGFGPGANGPLTVVAQLDRPGRPRPPQRQLPGSRLQRRAGPAPDVASVSPVHASRDGAVLVRHRHPRAAVPQDAATGQLLDTLQDTTLPGALAPDGAHGYVTGSLAGQLEFREQVGSRLPVIIGVVIAAAFVLLLLASFRSPVLALKAAILNLLSIGAAYGVIVAVFQWGWGSSLLGVSEKVPDRVLRADDDVRHRVRPVHGLRGLPAVPGPRGLAGPPGTTTPASPPASPPPPG